MEDIVNKIISIDKETIKVIETTEKIKKNSELDLKNRLCELEKTLLEEAKTVAEKEFTGIINQGIAEVKMLKENENSKISTIDNVYKSKKDELVERLFQNLLKENE